MSHILYITDNKNLGVIEEKSISLTVTSPPYVTTEFYKGQEFRYEDFLEEFKEVCAQLFRVTQDGGRFALNIADIITKYRYSEENLMARTPLGSDTLQIAMSCGWRLLERFIWDKGFTRNFGGPLLGSYPYPLTLYNNNYFEYVYILRKPGKRRVSKKTRENSRFTLDEWRQWTQKWWRIESITEKCNYHRAIFPVELPYRLIRMYSYIGDTILDPYAGTGATTIAAFLASRNSIGFENDPKAKQLYQSRIRDESKFHKLTDLDLQFIEGENALQ